MPTAKVASQQVPQQTNIAPQQPAIQTSGMNPMQMMMMQQMQMMQMMMQQMNQPQQQVAPSVQAHMRKLLK